MRMNMEEALELVGELKKQGYIAHYAFDNTISIGMPHSGTHRIISEIYRAYVIVEGKKQL